jgi:hypothetical protein
MLVNKGFVASDGILFCLFVCFSYVVVCFLGREFAFARLGMGRVTGTTVYRRGGCFRPWSSRRSANTLHGLFFVLAAEPICGSAFLAQRL